jgi:hypothetical protein
MLLHQKYKNLKHILTGIIKVVVVDGNLCIKFGGINRSRLSLAVTKFQPVRKKEPRTHIREISGVC